MKKQWNTLTGDNRGSGIIVVLISMVCVGLMGASLLFMSYTAMRLKVTERQASKDFYSAETAIDEIRAGVQTAVSEAIASSYKYVLETYSSGEQITDRFKKRFILDLMTDDLFENAQFDSDGNFLSAKCVVGELESYVSHTTGVGVTSNAGRMVTKNAVEDTLILKGIEVKYTAANDYTTTISTDLSIAMPKFVYTPSKTSFSGLPQHALIAKTALTQTSGNNLELQISGSAYAGKMMLDGAGNQMTIKNGTLVCAENAEISGKGPAAVAAGSKLGRLVTDDTVKFWAGHITVNGDSSVNLNGETRVLDDLELAGVASQATLSGIYYGFGDGTVYADDIIKNMDGTTTPVKPSKRSSAILVNGLKSKLDVSSLKQLILAGRAYISDSLYSVPSSGTTGVPTVESISVRSNQQMYLIDFSKLEIDYYKNNNYEGVTQNPFILPDDVVDTVESPVLSRIRLKGGEVVAGGRLATRMYRYGNQTLVYCYMEFADPSATNKYFEDYFAENADKMNSYLVNRVNGNTTVNSNLNASGIYSLGYTIQGKDGAYSIGHPSGVVDCAGMRSTFTQLKTTLVDANTDPGVDNPYDYIVNQSMTDTLGDNEERKFTWYKKDEFGNVVQTVEGIAVVTNGKYEIDTSQTNLRVVIAANRKDRAGNVVEYGDVTVETGIYKGVIICEGTLDIQGNVDMASAASDVINAFDAVDSNGITLREYLRDGVAGSGGEDDSSRIDGVDGWKLDTLVTYKNWTKS